MTIASMLRTSDWIHMNVTDPRIASKEGATLSASLLQGVAG